MRLIGSDWREARPGRLRRRRATRRHLATAAALAVVAVLGGVLLTGCSLLSGPSDALVLYSGQHEETTDALVDAFEKATGIEVSIHSDDEDTLAEQIATEGKRSPADVIFTENSPALAFLDEKGLLAKVDPPALADTEARYDASDGDWVGVSARVSVLVYNPSLISKSQLPTHVLELADPKYKGKLAFAAGETDFQPIVTSVARSYGQARALQWLQGIKANAGSHVYPDNETIASYVNQGVVAFGVVNQYYWYRMRAEIGASRMRSDIAYFAPADPGYVVDVSGAAVLASSRHQAAAQRFIAFITSGPGQEIIARPESLSYEYPIDSGVQGDDGETPFADLRPNPISVADLGTGAKAISLLQKAGLL